MNTLDTTREQLLAVNEFFDAQKAISDRLVYVDESPGNPGLDNKGEDHTDRLAA
jgi:tRNA-dihydrouridine synthase B